MQKCKYDKITTMRTTITFNDQLFKKLKIRAAETGESISDLVQDAVKFQLLEDLDDLETIKKRESEPTLSFDQLVKDFKKEGLL
jgi:hypothetical protein